MHAPMQLWHNMQFSCLPMTTLLSLIPKIFITQFLTQFLQSTPRDRRHFSRSTSNLIMISPFDKFLSSMVIVLIATNIALEKAMFVTLHIELIEDKLNHRLICRYPDKPSYFTIELFLFISPVQSWLELPISWFYSNLTILHDHGSPAYCIYRNTLHFHTIIATIATFRVTLFIS